MKTVAFLLPRDLIAEIKQLAADAGDGTTQAQVIRQSLRAGLKVVRKRLVETK